MRIMRASASARLHASRLQDGLTPPPRQTLGQERRQNLAEALPANSLAVPIMRRGLGRQQGSRCCTGERCYQRL